MVLPTAIVDAHGIIRHVNTLTSEISGYDPSYLIGSSINSLLTESNENKRGETKSERIRNPNYRIDFGVLGRTVLQRDGNKLQVECRVELLMVEDAEWSLVSFSDQHSTHAVNELLGEAEQHFRLAFEENMAPMMFTDLEDRILAVNAAFCRMVGRTVDDLMSSDSQPFTHPDDVGISEVSHERMLKGEIGQARYVKRYLHSDGRMIVAEVSKTPARNKEQVIQYFIVSERDITEERELAAQLSHQALHDPLTGLANRSLFDDRLAQAHSRLRRRSGICALMLLDLDNFKGVNDSYGHVVGDQLLVEVSLRLASITRSTDTLSRFGGDEFLYLAEGLVDEHEAEQVAIRLLSSFNEPFSVMEANFEQRASLGFVVWDETSTDNEYLVRDADIALYEAKRRGKSRHMAYVPGMHQQSVNRFSLGQNLHLAITANELSMHYQPIVELASSTIVGFEALMRWRLPTRGWVPPSVFIPLAEQSDLILELGRFALHEAIVAASSWQHTAAKIVAPYVTVNLSARQFHDPTLVPFMQSEIAAAQLDPSRLMIEITEGIALLEIGDTLSTLAKLGQLGIGVALDDFGTGFSSLSYLGRLNPTVIKIDQSFVRPPEVTERSERLLEAIVLLGRRLDIVTLAEGIESMSQLNTLREMHCVLGQGFLFSAAVPYQEATSMLERRFEL